MEILAIADLVEVQAVVVALVALLEVLLYLDKGLQAGR
jgi:hypothetical protein